MNAFSSKLAALAAAFFVNGAIMASVGYLFALQAHPHLSAVSFAKAVVAHQWLS
jgi:hypothetical protein